MIRATIPNDRLALGILATNLVLDGDDFQSDGYVYRDGKRVRKWFSSRGRKSKYFWEPCLNDIPRLESIFFRLKERGDARWKESQKLFNKVKKLVNTTRGGDRIFHARASESHCLHVGNEVGSWVEIRCSEDRFGPGLSYSWQWHEEKPSRPLHIKWGQKFYDLFHKSETQYMRASLVRSYLLEAIQRDIRKKHPKPTVSMRVFRYTINGREHWLREESTRFGGRELVWLAEPGEYISEII